MKKWEDLTKGEKEKLDMYIKLNALWQPIYLIIILGCIVGMIVAIPLILTLYEPMVIAGLVIIALVAYFFFVMFLMIEQDKKKMYLMFGIDKISEDIFDISKEELRNVKKVYRKVK